MGFVKEYLTVGENKWPQTVKVSMKIGFFIGLFAGLVILMRIL